MTNTETIRSTFEDSAHLGYVSAGLADTDGHFAPNPRSVTVRSLRQAVPVGPEYFRYGNDFRPTQDELDAYNATFHVGTDYRPQHLVLAVNWSSGWKTYEVTGTRHAYYLLRKLATRRGFVSARLNTPLVRPDGYLLDNVIHFLPEDLTGSDRHGTYAALLDRNNTHYSLTD